MWGIDDSFVVYSSGIIFLVWVIGIVKCIIFIGEIG